MFANFDKKDFDQLILSVGLLLLVGIVSYKIFADSQLVKFSRFSDRDLVRASHVLHDLPSTGVEVSYGDGFRVPGGFLYYLMALPLFLSDNPTVSAWFIALLFMTGAFVLFSLLARDYGFPAGLAAMLFYLTSHTHTAVLKTLWNPAYLPLFLALSYFFMLRVLKNGEVKSLKWAFVFLVLAMQIHLSAALLILPFGASLALERVKLGLREWSVLIAASFLFYLPYLVSEIFNGFPNTGLVLNRHHDSGALLALFVNCVLMGIAVVLIQRARDSKRLFLLRDPTFRFCLLCLVGILSIYKIFSMGTLNLSEDRHHLILIPAETILVALIVSYLYHRFRARPFFLGLFMIGALSGVIGFYHDHRNLYQEESSYHYKERLLEQMRAMTGWSLSDVQRRVVVFSHPSEDSTLKNRPINYLLETSHAKIQDTVPDVCGLLIQHLHPDDFPIDEHWMNHAFHQSAPDFNIIRRSPLGSGTFILYSRRSGGCFNNMTNRYLLTPEEKQAEALAGSLSLNSSKGQSSEPDLIYALRIEPDIRALLIFHRTSDPTLFEVILHSNQLRGHAQNNGKFSSAMLRNLKLIIDRGDHQDEVSLGPKYVGEFGQLAPISLGRIRLSGARRIYFSSESLGWIHHPQEKSWDKIEGISHSIELKPL